MDRKMSRFARELCFIDFFLQSRFLNICSTLISHHRHPNVKDFSTPRPKYRFLLATCTAAKKRKCEPRPEARTNAMKGYHVVSLKLTPTPKEPCECKKPILLFSGTVMMIDLPSESSHAEDANDVLWIRRSVLWNINTHPRKKRRDDEGSDA